MSAIPTSQHAIGQLRLVNHWCHEELWTPNTVVKSIGVFCLIIRLGSCLSINNLLELFCVGSSNWVTRGFDHRSILY